jgi:hypothetical protein
MRRRPISPDPSIEPDTSVDKETMMHWLDPDFLPETMGTIRQFTQTPLGEADGLVLDDDTYIHVPPHLTGQMLEIFGPGDAVWVRGARLRAVPVIAAVALAAADGRRVVDEGPGNHGKPAKPSLEPMAADGVVRVVLRAPKCELRGAVLTDGTVLRLGGKDAERFADLIHPGLRIEARGKGMDTALGRVLETRELHAVDHRRASA